MKKLVAELEGPELDYLVAKAEGNEARRDASPQKLCQIKRIGFNGITGENNKEFWLPYSPTTDWSIAGPIIERERIDIMHEAEHERWAAGTPLLGYYQEGDTPLIAAMRALVASKFGDTVEVPDVS